MTNFRHSQARRVARKRPSRTSRTVARRKAFDNRYREWSEIHDDYKLVDENGTRLVMFNGESGGTVLGPWIGPDGNRSARRNRRANHKRARDPREIGLTSFEPMPYGYERWNGSVWLDSWVDQYNSELERIETMFNDGHDVTNLVNGLYNLADTFDYNAKTSHRANRRVATNVPDWAVDNNGNKLVIGEWYKTPSEYHPQDFQFLENGTRDWSGDWDSWESLREFLEHPKSPGVIPSDWDSHTSRRERRQPVRRANRRRPHYARHGAKRKRAMDAVTIQDMADAIFEFDFDNSQDKFDDIYETDTYLVYEAIERYLDGMGYEYDDYDVTDIASFIAGGNSSW